MFSNKKLKIFQYSLLICIAFLPWNATAVNTGSWNKKSLSSQVSEDVIENLLIKSLVEITQGNTKQAMLTVNKLIKKAPNFKLAHLIQGDLLSVHSQTLANIGNLENTKASKKNYAEIEALRDEARTRMNYYFSKDARRLTPNIPVQMNESQQHLILIDTVKSRLFLYRKLDSGLEYVADYYTTIGKNGSDKKVEGDKRTPVGVYFANKKIATPLSEFYGDSAYPLNYPNELDRHEKKTGNGIWLHGTPKDTYSRPPRASDGCVVLSNPDIRALSPILQKGNTPVIISDNIDWIDSTKTNFKKIEIKSLNTELEKWREDWVSQNTKQYLSHYSNDFFYSKGNFSEWKAHKQGVQSTKPKVTIEITNISIFGYPTVSNNNTKNSTMKNQPLVVIDFDQYYKSPTLKNKMRKRQYWQYENNAWKIIYEGAA